MRERLFELLGARIDGARFLDLCAGSGAVGIEALSRGAEHATFVDRSRKMCGFIESNLGRCGVSEGQVEVVESDALLFLRRAAAGAAVARPAWDVAFFDPPYAADYGPVMELFGAGVALRRVGVLVVEHYCGNRLPDSVGRLRRWRAVVQGESCLSFYERK